MSSHVSFRHIFIAVFFSVLFSNFRRVCFVFVFSFPTSERRRIVCFSNSCFYFNREQRCHISSNSPSTNVSLNFKNKFLCSVCSSQLKGFSFVRLYHTSVCINTLLTHSLQPYPNVCSGNFIYSLPDDLRFT